MAFVPTSNSHSFADICTASSVSASLVNECLCLYPDTHRHLVDFRYNSMCLVATLLPHEIDYSTIKVDYYTASQFVLVASQMSYVLSGCLFLDPAVAGAPAYLYPRYLELLRAGKVYYTELRQRLRRKTSNRVNQKIGIRLKRLVRRRNILLLISTLELPEHNGSIDITTVMPTWRAEL